MVVLSSCACSSLFFASLFLRLIAASLLPASAFFGSLVVTHCGSFIICCVLWVLWALQALVVLDFLLPFYFMLISCSRLLTILAPKVAPTPNQKPSSPVPINNTIPLSSSLLGLCTSRCTCSTCLFSIFITFI